MNCDFQGSRIGRNTRSNSSTESTLDTIKSMLNEQKVEIVSKIEELSIKVTNLVSRIDQIESSIQKVAKTQNEHRKEIDDIKEFLSSTSTMDGILEEVEQRQFRASNLILFGLPEADSGTVSEREEFDGERFKEIADTLGVANVGWSHSFRLGKVQSNKPRPLRVKITEPEKKSQLLRRSKNLRNSLYRNVFIKHDLTLLQQANERKLRIELKERRDRNEDVRIYRGKIQNVSKTRQNFHH